MTCLEWRFRPESVFNRSLSRYLLPPIPLSASVTVLYLICANISTMTGWYARSSRFIYDAFGRHHPSAFGSNSRISYKNVLNMNKQRSSPFVDGEKRFYSGDRRRIKHPIISALTMAGCVVVGGFEILKYLEKSRFSLEIVPYTNRRHFMLYSISQEKEIGKSALKLFKSHFNEVATDHPLSIRAQKIGHNIAEVVKSQNAQLNEFEWEFVVVDDPSHVCGTGFPGGKIIVPSGLLSRFRRDDEVAAFIANEVGHAVGRHLMETLSNQVRERHSMAIFRWILSPFFDSKEAESVLSLPDLRRMKLEADYIGLIVMAYAGYDPRVVPRLWEQFGNKTTGADYLSSQPSGKTRARVLSQPQVMDEALSIYRGVLAQPRVETQ